MSDAGFPQGDAYALPGGRAFDPNWEVTPLQVAEAAKGDGHDLLILDVREPGELRIASVDTALAVPMGEIKQRLDEIEDAAEGKTIVAMCHTGVRSMQVAAFLRTEGELEPVYSMAGGIDAWSVQVDPSIPRY